MSRVSLPRAGAAVTAAVAGVNTVTLFWTKAGDPVSYYLATYGTAAGAQTYGNPNVGGANTTSYTVSSLAGGITYYFRVRGGNGCAPGDYSNELAAAPVGGFVAGPAAGFAAGVLGTTTEEVKSEAMGAATPEVLGGEQEQRGGTGWWVFWGTIGLGGLGVIFFLRRRGQLG